METLLRLNRQMDEGRLPLTTMDAYLTGTAPLQWLAPEIAESTQGRLRSMAVGWPRLVVSAIEERLNVEGFRVAGSQQPDPGLWQVWQANNMDEESQKAHVDALIYGRSYVLVWVDERGAPRITVESPSEVHVVRYPGSRRRKVALKRWVEDDHGHAVLFQESKVWVGDASP